MFKRILILPLIIFLAFSLTACNGDAGEKEPASPPVEETETPSTDNGEEYVETGIEPQLAFDKYMEKYPDTKVSKLELDKQMAGYLYKLEGFDMEKEYELEIDFISGAIVKEDIDREDDRDLDGEITRADVEKVGALVDQALEEAGPEAVLKEWTLEAKYGKAILEVEIDKKGLDDIEYTYDVETGELLEIDN